MAYSAQARQNMITNQLEPSGVMNDAILHAFSTIPREMFVPEALQGTAYLDEEIPLGHGRSVMEPRIFGKLVQEAGITRGTKLLDLGCGTGYSTAVFGLLGANVIAVESVSELAEIARHNLRDLKIETPIFSAAINSGYVLKAPYDVVFINGAVELISDDIIAQMAEGARLLTVESVSRPMQGLGAHGKAVCHIKQGKTLYRQELFDASAQLLPEFRKRESFQF